MLEGKKTYLVAIAAILSAVASALAETITWPEALALIVPALLGMTIRSGVTAETAKRAAGALFLVCTLALTSCATAPQTTTQPSANKPAAELGQGRTSAAAAFMKSAATSEHEARVAPEARAVGAEVTVPFALWNAETKAWQIPLGEDGKPYLVHATAVRDFNYIVAGTVSNAATVSGTASGTQTQGGTAGGTSGQTANPSNTVSPSTNVSGLPGAVGK
jgi:hypothetical protein